MQDGFVITNAQVVTPEGVREGVSVQVENGRIVGIGEGSPQGAREIDAGGNYLFPGFVDMHSDAIEKGIEPRPNTFFPVDIAVFELDKKIASCGITTMYHSLSFAELEVGLRNNNTAAEIIREINQFRRQAEGEHEDSCPLRDHRPRGCPVSRGIDPGRSDQPLLLDGPLSRSGTVSGYHFFQELLRSGLRQE